MSDLLKIESANQKTAKLGWFVQEQIGIAVVNPRATITLPLCCVCKNKYNITLLKEVDMNVQDCTVGDTHTICISCARKTRRMLKRLNKMDPHELPVYINDPNIFIRNRASELLNK